jgi:hypothetical protein
MNLKNSARRACGLVLTFFVSTVASYLPCRPFTTETPAIRHNNHSTVLVVLKKVSETLRHQVFAVYSDASRVPDTFSNANFLLLTVNLRHSNCRFVVLQFSPPWFYGTMPPLCLRMSFRCWGHAGNASSSPLWAARFQRHRRWCIHTPCRAVVHLWNWCDPQAGAELQRELI